VYGITKNSRIITTNTGRTVWKISKIKSSNPSQKHEEIKVSEDKRTPAQPATQIELPHFEFRVPETDG
jgi:hypothetical protein